MQETFLSCWFCLCDHQQFFLQSQEVNLPPVVLGRNYVRQGVTHTDQFQGSLRRGPQGARSLLQQHCTTSYTNPLGIEPSTDTVRTLYECDLGRGELSREVVSSGESCYPSSENGYMRLFRPT